MATDARTLIGNLIAGSGWSDEDAGGLGRVAGDVADEILRVHAHELAEATRFGAAQLVRAHTEADYGHVVSAYGWAYANGWRAGRERAAELIEGGAEA